MKYQTQKNGVKIYSWVYMLYFYVIQLHELETIIISILQNWNRGTQKLSTWPMVAQIKIKRQDPRSDPSDSKTCTQLLYSPMGNSSVPIIQPASFHTALLLFPKQTLYFPTCKPLLLSFPSPGRCFVPFLLFKIKTSSNTMSSNTSALGHPV